MNDIDKVDQFVSNNEDTHVILYIDQNHDKDLIELINKTQHQGCNCLDLSKRNIKEFPSQLLAFPSLQVIPIERLSLFIHLLWDLVFVFRRK